MKDTKGNDEMYTVIARYENGEKWENSYNDLDVAIAVMHEVTEFGGDGCVVDGDGVVVAATNIEIDE